jgi:nicotinate-nucleotide adenylyltransferase
MKVGLYFGSFNPIHIGHLIIANHVLNETPVQEIWFVVSPHNPFKETSSLLNENHRLHLVRLAIEAQPKFRSSNIEFTLPRPSYTSDTMIHLSEKYPQHEFSIIMGGDSFQNIQKWKNSELLLRDYDLFIYQRPEFPIDTTLSSRLTILDAPLLEISSTLIRTLVREKKSIQFLVTDEVRNDILANGYYAK